jgi:serine/threonine protein kinase
MPSETCFSSFSVVDIFSQIIFVDGDSSPEFDEWPRLRRSGVRVDFRRTQRVGFDLPCLRDYVVDLLVFEEKSIIGECNEVSNQIYHRIDDELLVFVKSNSFLTSVPESQMENENEKLINLQHPCISAPIGFVLPIESGNLHGLKIIRFCLEGFSLAAILSVNPVWWTSTVKAKVVAGIVFGLRFAHSFGLLHNHLTASNILFDCDHFIPIVAFKPISLEVGESENEGEERAQLGAFLEKDGHKRGTLKRLRRFLLKLLLVDQQKVRHLS